MQTLNTIVLLGQYGNHDEGVADAAILPGEAVRLAADGKYDPETLATGNGLKIAKEDGARGKTVTQAYAPGDVLFFYTPLPGDRLNVLVKAGETLLVGDRVNVEGNGSGKFVKTVGSTNADGIALTGLRVHDNLASFLPTTAANDDLALITGTPGTDAPRVRGVDFGGTTTTAYAAFEYTLPAGYKAGGVLTLRVRGGMVTGISDTACDLDASVWKVGADGTVGADICATAAQSINSLTKADKNFTITPTGLVAGDRLIVRLKVTGEDTLNAAVMIPEVSSVTLISETNGTGQLECLEASGGVLSAATLLACRVTNG